MRYAQRLGDSMPTYTPPVAVAENAQRALDVRASKPPSERGMTAVGLARANQLAARRPVSIETIQRMVAYFQRHEIDKEGATWSEQGAGWQAWYGWGGDEGYQWARDVLERYQMDSTKAGSRHSASDMQMLRMARAKTKAYADEMVKIYSDLGDDGIEYSDFAGDMMAQAAAVQPTPPSNKTIKAAETTLEVLQMLYAWQMQIMYTAYAGCANVLDGSAAHEVLEDVRECMMNCTGQTMNAIRQRGELVPVTMMQLCDMVPEAGLTPSTTDGAMMLENVNALNNALIELIRMSVPVVVAEQEYDVQLMLQSTLAYLNKITFIIAQYAMGVYDDDGEGEGMAPVEADDAGEDMGERMADEYAVAALADRETTPKERERMPASDFVIPESRNFPIITPDDIPAGVSSWGRYRGPVSFEEFKQRLITLARRKGPEFVAALPQAWRDEMAQRVARALIRM